LHEHVDRYDTHVISAILHVVQDLDDGGPGWPLTIRDHENATHTLSLRPGDALYYESARMLHARRQPMAGVEFGNVFVSFRPKGWADPPPPENESESKNKKARAAALSFVERRKDLLSPECYFFKCNDTFSADLQHARARFARSLKDEEEL